MTPAKSEKKERKRSDFSSSSTTKGSRNGFSDKIEAVLEGLSKKELVEMLTWVSEQRKASKMPAEVPQTERREHKEITVPVAIFADREISGFQAICKYLKENKSLKFSEIAVLLERDQRTVWTAYHQGKKRKPVAFDEQNLQDSLYHIPLSIFSQRKYSVLEALVKYFREERALAPRKIAGIIGQDQRVVATVYSRVRKKSQTSRGTINE